MRNRDINIITWGGLGDAVLITPALKALKKKYPGSKLTVYYIKRHRQLFINNPHIDSLKEATFWAAPVKWLMARYDMLELRSTDHSKIFPSINYNINIVDVIAEMLGIELTDRQMHIYLTEQELQSGKMHIAAYKNPVTFNPYAICSTNKEWQPQKWEELIASMPDYSFIQVGLKKEQLINGAIDLRGKSIRESVAIVKASGCYVGVDSFLAHAAAAVNTPAVVLFGPSSPVVYGHRQNINISRKLSCAPCIEMIMDSQCPYNKKCMHQITVNEVRDAVLKQTGRPDVVKALSEVISESF